MKETATCIPRWFVALCVVAALVFFAVPYSFVHWQPDIAAVDPPLVLFRSGGQDEVMCRPANGTISVATQIINAFVQLVVVPAVQDDSNIAIIPEQEDDHLWVDRILLHNFRLKSLSVKTASPDSHSMTVSARQFGLEVNETRFRIKYLGIRCYGHFTATLNETDVDSVLNISLLPESRWNAEFSELTFKWGTLAIQHALDSKACGIAQSIVEVFIGELDKYIAEKVQKKLDEDGKSKATQVLNDAFASVVVRALTPPVMTPDRLTVMLDATPSSVGCPPLAPATELPGLLAHDIAVHTTVRDINNAWYNFAVQGKLRWQTDLPDVFNTSLFADVLPELYKVCPECPMYTLVDSPEAPEVVFLPVNTMTLTLSDVVVGLYVVPRSTAEKEEVTWLMKQRSVPHGQTFAAAYRRVGLEADVAARERGDAIPVLALACSATLGVRNMTFENGRALHYEFLPLMDVDVSVVASNIGDVDTAEIVSKGTQMWNNVGAPLINAMAPYKLPRFLRKAEAVMTLVNIDSGVNIGIMDSLVEAFNASPVLL